ncbi:MAG: PhzF family phenazine biosynthesis protein, partial [Pseudomonadota bacterium]
MSQTIPFAQIDAFARAPFKGNQACVMPLEGDLPDSTLQAIAAENNVAETAFLWPLETGRWRLRWFTPAVEVPLCGHATLAAAHYLLETGRAEGEQIVFETKQSGELSVRASSDGLEMDFPAPAVEAVSANEAIIAALGARPIQSFTGPFFAAEFQSPADIKALSPDYTALSTLGTQGDGWGLGNFGCFAIGNNGVDVVSRFFAPGSGIDEDPATGSWHCMLAAILGPRFGRRLTCHQA